ncbi:hypothetical protein EVAR_47427_1 [Eumeta japonica]|uniref:Uncharacterized protein n=1 Tax=Eumeta variegata TaxID=151549 RepID=A0A4C1Y2V6_EUMVA|nr:hypothetical protein EVAR_47427_1 [Eumeta japonica]
MRKYIREQTERRVWNAVEPPLGVVRRAVALVYSLIATSASPSQSITPFCLMLVSIVDPRISSTFSEDIPSSAPGPIIGSRPVNSMNSVIDDKNRQPSSEFDVNWGWM